MTAFNDRWTVIEEAADDPSFDERESFRILLEEVDSLANASAEWDFDGGPGRSSAYELFYANSETNAQEALKQFTSARS
jgi:hypothetical protein